MILFRADGGLDIGMGHIYTTTAIANKLRENGLKCEFLMKNSNSKYEIGRNEVKKNGFKINDIKSDKEVKKFVFENKPELIFIDLKNLNKSLLKNLNKIPNLTIITTSFFNKIPKKIEFNYLINWFAGLERSEKKEYYLGPNFFPIRENVIPLHEKEKNFKKSKKDILVTIGGGKDKYKVLLKISQELRKISNIGKVYILLGNNSNENYKKEFGQLPKNFEIFNTTDDIFNLMYNADIAITSGGNTTYELACIGTPAIYMCIVPHQLKTAEAWHKIGAGINLGYASKISTKKIRETVTNTLSDEILLKKMSEKGKEKVDGKGLERITKIILKDRP